MESQHWLCSWDGLNIGNEGHYLRQKGNFMNITLPGHIQITVSLSFLIVIGIIIAVILILQIIALRRRRRRTPAHHAHTPTRQAPTRRTPARRTTPAPPRPAGGGWRMWVPGPPHKTDHRIDHGERVARQHGTARSPEWPRVAHEHLAIEPGCAVCGHRGQGLQVHHIKPFHLHPGLELDPNNLITLCEIPGRDHHLLIGHLDDWDSYNVRVRPDSQRYHKMSADKIRANPNWQKEVLQRP